MLSVYKVALAPVLFAQALWLRHAALRLPEPAGPRSGCAPCSTASPELRVLVIGDSSAAGVGVLQQIEALAAQTAAFLTDLIAAPVHWQLVAKSGISTRTILKLLQAHELERADVVVCALGVNDVAEQRKPADFVRDYKRVIQYLADRVGARAAVVNGLPPLHILPSAPQPLRWYLGEYAKRLDAQLQGWCSQADNLAYVSLQWAAVPSDMASDRFHPGQGQYRRWARLVANEIAAFCAPPRNVVNRMPYAKR